DRDLSGVTSTLSRNLVSGSDVFGERALSTLAVFSSAARAHFTRSVPDDPCGAMDEFSIFASLLGFEPEADSFSLPRPFILIASIDRRVVKCLPAISSMVSRPLAA